MRTLFDRADLALILELAVVAAVFVLPWLFAFFIHSVA